MERESFTKEQLHSLQMALGFGAIIIDWTDIDFEAGRGIMKGNDRCIWNKDGRRIEICVGGGVLSASQTKEPDPEYPGFS